MPLYDFTCEVCGLVTEARRGYEDSSIPCPACGAKAKRQAVYAYQSTKTPTVGVRFPSQKGK